MSDNPIRVVAAVIRRRMELLICLRPPHKRHGDLWEFPGGKCEPGESDADAISRELAEELGVEVADVGPPIMTLADPGSSFLIVFLPTEIRGEPQSIEHSALRWATPSIASELPLAPSDRTFVQFLLSAQ